MTEQYECVLRRIHFLCTEKAAVGRMKWDSDRRLFVFTWKMPVGFKPERIRIVEVDLYDADNGHIGHAPTFYSMQAGDSFTITYAGRGRGGDDSADDIPDGPKPPGVVLDFDPNDLLTPAPVGAR
jgi:hypothetical protein